MRFVLFIMSYCVFCLDFQRNLNRFQTFQLVHNFNILCGINIYNTGDSDPRLQTRHNLAFAVKCICFHFSCSGLSIIQQFNLIFPSYKLVWTFSFFLSFDADLKESEGLSPVVRIRLLSNLFSSL